MSNPDSQGTQASDSEMLWEFVEHGSEEAFRELVDKYVGRLMGTAVRRTGDASLAEEVVQNVFTVLARKARRLKAAPTLAGWLHRTTMLECNAALRKERRRAERIKRIMENARTESDGESTWDEALPQLDEAIEALPASDRDVILMRYWENRSFREIGQATGKSEGASQKQAERALQKLSTGLQRRGVAVSIGALAAGISLKTAHAVPAGLATTISQGALSGASGLGAGTLIINSIQAMTYAKTKAAIAIALVAAIPIGVQWKRSHESKDKLGESGRGPAADHSTAAGSSRSGPGSAPDGAESKTDRSTGTSAGTRAGRGQSFLAEWEQALAERDEVKRSVWIGRLIEGLTAGNAPEVAALFERLQKTGTDLSREQFLFMRAWGGLDGQSAVEYASSQSGGPVASQVMKAAIAGWAGQDPEAALAWTDSLEDGRNKEDILSGVVEGWALVDLEAASRFAESRPRTPARNIMRRVLMQQALAEGGLEGAREWFSTVNGEGHNQPYKQLAFDELSAHMLKNDPRELADWIKEDDGAAYLGGRAIRNTAHALAQESPAEALEWIDSMETLKEGQRTSSYSQIMATWAPEDPEAAGNWLAENPQHPRYDAMANRYIIGVSDVDPEMAMEWANSIEDETRRTNSRLIAAAGLLARDGEAVIPSLREQGFTEDMIKAAPAQAEFARANPFSEWAQRMTLGGDERAVHPLQGEDLKQLERALEEKNR